MLANNFSMLSSWWRSASNGLLRTAGLFAGKCDCESRRSLASRQFSQMQEYPARAQRESLDQRLKCRECSERIESKKLTSYLNTESARPKADSPAKGRAAWQSAGGEASWRSRWSGQERGLLAGNATFGFRREHDSSLISLSTRPTAPIRTPWRRCCGP